jgi:hypothetical protein
MNRSGDFLIQTPRVGGGPAAYAQAEQPDTSAESALRHGNGVANPNHVIGLSYRNLVDRDCPCDAEARGEGAALDQAGKPQPLIQPPALRPGYRAVTLHASFSSRSLANG